MQGYELVMALSLAPGHLVLPCLWPGLDPSPSMGGNRGGKVVACSLAILASICATATSDAVGGSREGGVGSGGGELSFH